MESRTVTWTAAEPAGGGGGEGDAGVRTRTRTAGGGRAFRRVGGRWGVHWARKASQAGRLWRSAAQEVSPHTPLPPLTRRPPAAGPRSGAVRHRSGTQPPLAAPRPDCPEDPPPPPQGTRRGRTRRTGGVGRPARLRTSLPTQGRSGRGGRAAPTRPGVEGARGESGDKGRRRRAGASHMGAHGAAGRRAFGVCTARAGHPAQTETHVSVEKRRENRRAPSRPQEQLHPSGRDVGPARPRPQTQTRGHERYRTKTTQGHSGHLSEMPGLGCLVDLYSLSTP